MQLYPIMEAANAAEEIINAGGIVYQQFECASCGARQTTEVPNTFFTHGHCKECGSITNIVENGRNSMAVFGGPINA